MWHIHTMEYYHSALKGMRFCVCHNTNEPEDMMLRKKCQTQKDKYDDPTHEALRIGRFTEMQSRTEATQTERGEKKELLFNGWFLFAVKTVVTTGPYTTCT